MSPAAEMIGWNDNELQFPYLIKNRFNGQAFSDRHIKTTSIISRQKATSHRKKKNNTHYFSCNNKYNLSSGKRKADNGMTYVVSHWNI